MRIGEFLGQMLVVVVETVIQEVFKRDFYFDRNNFDDYDDDDPDIPRFCKIKYAEDAWTDNFSLREFHSKDGTRVPKNLRGNIQILMEQLEVIKDYFDGARITITSGYRSPNHNKNVDGARRSRHMCGQAADFKIRGYSAREVQKGVAKLMKRGDIINGGLGSYGSFTHYDIGPKRRWKEKGKKFWNF